MVKGFAEYSTSGPFCHISAKILRRLHKITGVPMNRGRTIFSQLIDHLPMQSFHACVDRYNGNYRVKSFSCYDQFLCMAFAQLTHRDSLRDLITCLNAMRPKLYHVGIRGRLSRSTIADANENRDWRIYRDFAHVLIDRARRLYTNDSFGVKLKATAYALDSTTIDLCMSVFPWARFRQTKSAVKVHTMIDLRGNIPSFIYITDGKVHDVNILDEISPEAGSFYTMDRAYNDFRRLYRFEQERAFFVVRAKSNLDYRRIRSSPVDKSKGLRCDQTIVLAGLKTAEHYPTPLRRISFYDEEQAKKLVFLTNNFRLAPITITQLYKCRWQVELFFKWIKQHLRIKSFFGTSENAVKTQIWIAVSVYVAVAIMKRELSIERSLYEILQILDIAIFEKTPISTVFSEQTENDKPEQPYNQPLLFDC